MRLVVDLEVGGEDDAVLVLDEKPADLLRIVTADLRDPRGEVGHHVRVPCRARGPPTRGPRRCWRSGRRRTSCFGCRSITRSSAASSSSRGGILRACRRTTSCGDPCSSFQRSFVSSKGSQNARGSATWIETGMPSSPHFCHTGSSFGSSIRISSPAPSRRKSPSRLYSLKSGGAETMSFLDLLAALSRKSGSVPSGVIEIHVMHETPGKHASASPLLRSNSDGVAVRPCHRSAAEIDADADRRPRP